MNTGTRMSRSTMYAILCILQLWFSGGFAQQTLTIAYHLTEETPPPKILGNLKTDLNLPSSYPQAPMNQVQFRFTASYPGYQMDNSTGVLTAVALIDRESLCRSQVICQQELQVLIYIPNTGVITAKVTIVIDDINDNLPIFDVGNMTLQISEGTAVGTMLPLTRVSDADSPQYGVKEITPLDGFNVFRVTSTLNGDGSYNVQLLLTNPLDREIRDRYSLQIVAKDGGTPPLQDTLYVQIQVTDINDNAPMFSNATYLIAVPENTVRGTQLLNVTAYDPDLGLNGLISYNFSSTTLSQYGNLFAINPYNGAIVLVGVLDREAMGLDSTYTLLVSAKDHGTPPLTGYCTLIVNVTDVNDNPPSITVSTFTDDVVGVPEDSPVGTFVAYVSVSDPDSLANGEVICVLNSALFELVEMSEGDYKINTLAVFDREIKYQYVVTITCSDHGSRVLTTALNVTVHILDVNDNAPGFKNKIYNFTVPENNVLRTYLGQVTATDADIGENAALIYSVRNAGNSTRSDSSLSVDPLTGAIYTNRQFDYERQPFYQYILTATDGGQSPLSGTTIIDLNIQNVNDLAPVFNSIPSLAVLEGQSPGTEVGYISATDQDSPPFNVVWYALMASADSQNFKIDAQTGLISTTRVLDREALSTYNLTVKTYNPNPNAVLFTLANAPVTVFDINDNAPVFQFPTEANHTVTVDNVVFKNDIVTRIFATDADSGSNGQVRYSIVYGDDSNLFEIDDISGYILLTRNLEESDLESSYDLVFLAQDMGQPPLSGTEHLFININVTSRLTALSRDIKRANNEIPIIVISIVAFLLVCSVIVLVAVLYTRRRRKRTRHGQMLKYNCRVEVVNLNNSNNISPIVGIANGSKAIDPDQGSPKASKTVPAPASVYSHKPIMVNGQACSGSKPVCRSSPGNHGKAFDEIQLQVHDLVSHLEASQHLDSLDTSSATDSGKGSSDGDHQEPFTNSPMDLGHRPGSSTDAVKPTQPLLMPPLTTEPYYRLCGDIGVNYKPSNNSNGVTSLYPGPPVPKRGTRTTRPPQTLSVSPKVKKTVHFSPPSFRMLSYPETNSPPKADISLSTFQHGGRNLPHPPIPHRPDLLQQGACPKTFYGSDLDPWRLPLQKKLHGSEYSESVDARSDSGTTTSGSYCMDDVDFDILV